jgi:hypothetical protein
MNELVFATMAGTTAAARTALLWARSIRTFAGRYKNAPIWLMVPNHIQRLPAALRVELDKNKVRLLAFEASDEELDFPFAGKTIAAGTAEHLAQKRAELLVWMDRDSLIIQEPSPLNLAENKKAGYRPVDHTLIGSLANEPPDSFWSLIYNYCGVDAQQIKSMVTSVDERTIRPYFNAGLLALRPQRKLLQTWSERLRTLYRLPAFAPFYGRDIRYRLFMHQAVLAGVLLAELNEEELEELPYLVNYPLHMHDTYPMARRPTRLNDVYSCRYDTLVEEPDWEQLIQIDEPLLSWLYEERKRVQST